MDDLRSRPDALGERPETGGRRDGVEELGWFTATQLGRPSSWTEAARIQRTRGYGTNHERVASSELLKPVPQCVATGDRDRATKCRYREERIAVLVDGPPQRRQR